MSLGAIDVALTAIGRLARTRNASLRRQRVARVALDDMSVQVLGAIARLGPIRLGQVSVLVELEVSQLSKKVRRLVDEGLASQRIDPAERRACLLEVTASGRRALARYRAAADDILAQAFAGWSDEELQHASEIVGRIAATFQAVDSFGVRAGGR